MPMMHTCTGLTTALLLAAAGAAAAGPVSGTVRTRTREGVAPAAAVVYAEPLDAAAPRRPGRFTLAQKNKTFQPHLLPIPAGSTVEFPNNDPIFHNVFSLSQPQPFDLGLYRAGQSRARLFSQPGTYRVFCNIHPQMTAVVLVLPTPYATVAGNDGRFLLDLPPGRYRITALSERAEPVSVEVASVAGAITAPDLALDESSWVFVQHKDKFGKDYAAAAYRR
jgi:plastocyanin